MTTQQILISESLDNNVIFIDLKIEITKEILEAIEKLEGIASVDKIHRYKFRVIKGGVFSWYNDIYPEIIKTLEIVL